MLCSISRSSHLLITQTLSTWHSISVRLRKRALKCPCRSNTIVTLFIGVLVDCSCLIRHVDNNRPSNAVWMGLFILLLAVTDWRYEQVTHKYTHTHSCLQYGRDHGAITSAWLFIVFNYILISCVCVVAIFVFLCGKSVLMQHYGGGDSGEMRQCDCLLKMAALVQRHQL